MNLSEIQALWDKDSVIDNSQLDVESLKIAQLHSKYFKIFSAERYRYKQMEGEFRKLELEKYEFYTNGPTEDQYNNGWKMPAKGRIIKQEVDKYMQADQDIIDAGLKLYYQKEKLEVLESIITSLNSRSFNIKNCLDYIRWAHGGN